MKQSTILLLIISFAVNAFAQTDQKPKDKTIVTVTKTDTAPFELAKATLLAHGGDGFKNMKTLIVSGSVDVTTTQFPQTIPATFVIILSGDKYRLEIQNPIQPLKQIYDGQQTSSTINGFNFPPINRLGLPLLQKLGEKDFIVAALSEKLKKKKGFRITSPEGFYTDFFIDDKTGQVKGYESSYDINGREVTTSVEIDKFRTVEGAIIPERYSQRFDLGQITIYASFKAKEISVNTKINDDVFSLSK
ncbi:MAG: hypothetical protein M3Q33_05225 [Acidobacteriota bacterium]|nr:hypothetical protein [Acidobacteriota bacterium]